MKFFVDLWPIKGFLPNLLVRTIKDFPKSFFRVAAMQMSTGNFPVYISLPNNIHQQKYTPSPNV